MYVMLVIRGQETQIARCVVWYTNCGTTTPLVIQRLYVPAGPHDSAHLFSPISQWQAYNQVP